MGGTLGIWVSKRGFQVGNEGSDRGEGGSRVSVNEWNYLVKGPSFQATDGIDNFCCLVSESIVVDLKFHSELSGESGELGTGAIKFFRVWELFGPEGGDSSRWGSSCNRDRDGRGGGGASDIEVEVELGYLLFKVVDGFIDGGELCTSGIPLMANTLDKDGDVVK
jgi:hypothetical protein